MKIKVVALLFFIAFIFTCTSQAQNVQRPKLVLGIVVDQMRFDYLYNFFPHYGDGGFKRLMSDGSNFTFTHFNYSQTSTAPGHTTIYTGTTPYYHGIISNDWYDKHIRKEVNAVNDGNYKSVGSSDSEGEKSPHRLLSTTITDQLKLATGGKSKIISVSLKDRAAILPGGHAADAAYWYDDKTGNFITSNYYMKSLPDWINNFNERKLADKYLAEGWKLSLPETDYSVNGPDNSDLEKDIFDEGKTSFPHSFDNAKNKYEALMISPYGNNLVEELAKAALIYEKLGKHDFTDFLAISFSSTDKVGHEFGSNSYEIEDTYVKLDSAIADLLVALDQQVGKGNYLLFLTADHASNTTLSLLKKENMPTGGLNEKLYEGMVKSFAAEKYGDENLVENFSNRAIVFNRDVIKENNLNINEVEQTFAGYLRDNFPAISTICTRDFLEGKKASREPVNTILNGFNPAISGDIVFDLQPGFLKNYQEKGTQHGTTYAYDTHVPLIFYGWHVPKQEVNTPVYTVDIAPTIADLIKIAEPSACIGIPLIKY